MTKTNSSSNASLFKMTSYFSADFGRIELIALMVLGRGIPDQLLKHYDTITEGTNARAPFSDMGEKVMDRKNDVNSSF